MRDKAQKRHNTEGGDTIADYIRADTTLPAYLPYPRFLLKMEISQTAKLLYALLLDRSTLSQKNGWQDGEGRMPIIEIFKGAAPYVICNVIVLISISLWGPLTTALPQLLGYSIF